MRARFTTAIAGVEFAFQAGTEVSVGGADFGPACVPEKLGRQWLSSGVLEAIGPESTALHAPETAVRRGAKSRPMAGSPS